VEPERWEKIDPPYHSALEREASSRTAFIEHACDGDELLRGEVESLLAQAQNTEDSLEAQAMHVAAGDLTAMWLRYDNCVILWRKLILTPLAGGLPGAL
jgi:hypothetical protein